MTLKVGVFGGNGFVGSRVLRGLVQDSHTVTCFSRTGVVPKHLKSEEWAASCTWKAADALQRDTYEDDLSGLDAVIVSIGSPPVPTRSQAAHEAQRRANGQTCVEVIEASREAGVRQVVLVNAVVPSFAPAGYREGKKMAEECAKAFAETSEEHGATILYPSMMFGTKYTKGGAVVPLTPFLWPISVLLRVFPCTSGKRPINVTRVAAAAILAATDSSYYGKFYEFKVDEMATLDPVR